MAPKNVTVKSGDALELVCLVSSAPPAVIGWKFDNRPIMVPQTGPLSYERPFPMEMVASKLKIDCADQTKAGEYSCVAENALKIEEAKAVVTVKSELKLKVVNCHKI